MKIENWSSNVLVKTFDFQFAILNLKSVYTEMLLDRDGWTIR